MKNKVHLLITILAFVFSSAMAIERTTYTTSEGAVLKISLSTIGNTATVMGLEDISFEGVLNIPLEVEYKGTTYSVVTIGEEAFMNCEISAVNFGNVSTVGASAFRNCSNISSLDLSNVKYIGDYAFYVGGSTLTSIIFSGKLQSVGTQAFPQGFGCSVTDVTVNVNDITEIIGLPIPFFYYFTEVKYYVAGELLKEIIIPEGITSLSGFNYIRGINLISLPSTLQSIAENSFTETVAPKIYCYAKTPPIISPKARPFVPLNDAVLYVPHGRKIAYIGANGWSSFTNIIEMEDEGETDSHGDSVTVENAGGLAEALASIDKEKITNLVIKGKLSAADIKVIRAAEGKLAELDTLDLSEVTLVPSDEYYYSYTRMMDGSMSPEYYRFFIGEARRDTSWKGETLSSWPPHYHDHYDPYLPYAFNGMSLKRIVWPASFDEVGTYAMSGCNKLQEFVMANEPIAIGDAAFSGCTDLLIIPELSKLQELGENAFYNCASLLKLEENGHLNLELLTNIPSGAFYGCKYISSIRFSDNLKAIGAGAFQNCKNLTSMNLSPFLSRMASDSFEGTPWFADNKESLEGITYIGTIAIGCDKNMTKLNFREGTLGLADGFKRPSSTLTEIQFPTTLQYIGNYAFREVKTTLTNITLPASLEGIGDYAFDSFTSLNAINLPDGLKEIGQMAFHKCAIQSVIIPESIERIGERAFYECGSLTNVTYNAPQVEGRFIFQFCDKLKHLVIGDKVKIIPAHAFDYCKMLEDVSLGSSLEVIDDYAFESCESLRSIKFPLGLRKIGKRAFYRCRSLQNVDFPLGLYEIGGTAFHDCEALEEVILPEGLVIVGGNDSDEYGAFANCKALKKVELPSTLCVMGKWAFRSGSIEMVISHIIDPFPITSYYDFGERSNSYTLYVPAGTKERYMQTEGWKTIEKIVEFPSPDVNQDEDVNEQDVMDIAHFVVGTPSDSFFEFLADINNDGTVNLGDAVVVVNEIIDSQNLVKARIASNPYEERDELILKEENGTLSLCMNNNRQYTAFQFDLYLPEKSEVAKMILNTGRNQNHQLIYNKLEDGHYRVAVLSTSNMEFNGIAGELLNMAINGVSRDDVSVHEIHFFDSNGKDYHFYNIDNSMETNIEVLTPYFSTSEKEFYNLNGQRISSVPQKGLNIIRMSDGTSKKVLIK